MIHSIGFIGLGKMGQNMILHLLEQDISVVAYNRTYATTEQFVQTVKESVQDQNYPLLHQSESIRQFIEKLQTPRIIVLMVKAGKPVDDVISELLKEGVTKGDIIIDAGNSFFEDSKRRASELAEKEIQYIDSGTSGGLEGARYGACLMLGGDKETVESLTWLWDAISGIYHPDHDHQCACGNEGECQCGGHNDSKACVCGNDGECQCDAHEKHDHHDHCHCGKEGGCECGNHTNHHEHECACGTEEYYEEDTEAGWTYFGPSGAGHFVKMVHNGVEYGIDQAIGEGFQLLAEGPYDLDLAAVADNWTKGSVVRGWLMELLADALDKDPRLSAYKGIVGGGETGKWTTKTATKHNVPQTILEQALKARENSQKIPTFAGKVVSALRYEYGGHKEEHSNT